MKIVQYSLRSTALACGLLAAPAFAATYSCDNDRASSQYPHCKTYQSQSDWTYASGQSHDYNGDDRRQRSSSSNGFYSWDFLTKRRYSFSVYLNNTAFTTPQAGYIAGDPTKENEFNFKYFNQNTASGGWHTIFSATAASIGVANFSSAKNVAGADGARASYSTSAAKAGTADTDDAALGRDDTVDTSARCGAMASEASAEIAAIQQKMLGATGSYRDVAGRFHMFFRNNQQDETVDFEVSQAQARSKVRSVDALGQVVETASDGKTFVQRQLADRSYRSLALAATPALEPVRALPGAVSTAASGTAAALPRFYRNAACEAIFVHREDAAHSAAAQEVTNPENYAFWLTQSPSRIAGHETLLGRSTTVIAGQQDAYLSQKLGAVAFRMWVDDATGLLLKLVGTDAAGATAYSIEAQSLAVDRGLQLPASIVAVPAGWKQLGTLADLVNGQRPSPTLP